MAENGILDNGSNIACCEKTWLVAVCGHEQHDCVLLGSSKRLVDLLVVNMSISEFIRHHLPKFQFAAVTITIILGTNTVYDRFFKHPDPVLIWDADGFSVSPTSNYSSWQVVATRKKLRDDCPLRSFDAHIIDRDGFVHQVTTSANKSTGTSSTGFEHFQFLFKVNDIESVPGGPAKFRGVLLYECKEGQQIIEYPDTEKLILEVRNGPK